MESRLEGDIFVPSGFQLGAISVGIKESGRVDLSLLGSDSDLVCAGVYTQNIIYAASIDWCKEITPSASVRGVIVNSGNANACTGEEGQRNNRELAVLAAKQLQCEPNQILVLSTGIIGHQLPIQQIETGFAKFDQNLGCDAEAIKQFCLGMTTTDKFLKIRSAKFEIDGDSYSITVAAKGAGMIGPNMATMLAVVITDFPLNPKMAQDCLSRATAESFNCIRVDGHTSTNDAVLLLGSRPLSGACKEPLVPVFEQTLTTAMVECAKLIPEDGEGATKVMALTVTGSRDTPSAKQVALAVADSPLVKTAIFGCDPNWGRIVSAAGYAGIPFDPKEVSLTILGQVIYQDGVPVKFDEANLSEMMKEYKEVSVDLVVGAGPGKTTIWASDLTTEYVQFNSDYST